MHYFCKKIKIFWAGGMAPAPDSTPYPSVPYSKFLDPPLVPISNVTDGFWRLLFILTPISCVLISPGSAEAYVG